MTYNYQKKVKEIEAICKKWNLIEKKEHVWIINPSKVKSYKDRSYEFDFRANNLKTYIKVFGKPKFKYNSQSIKDLNLETFEAFIEKRITNYQYEKYNMFYFSNKWRNCRCNVVLNETNIIYNDIINQLNKDQIEQAKLLEPYEIVQCPFGIFGCRCYKFDENGNIIHK